MSEDARRDLTLERRKFIALLGAAGAYVPPTLVSLLNSTPAYAGSSSSASLSSRLSSSGSLSPSGSIVSNYSSRGSSNVSHGSGVSSGSANSTSGGISGSTSAATSSESAFPSTSEGSSESSFPHTTTLFPVADTFVRRDSRNTNEGANPLIRVGVDPVTRGLVLFDRDEIYRNLFPGARVQLVLRIANNHNNWGQYDDRTISAHPLIEDFTGGNGRQSGMPGSQAQRGTGAGATWNSPDDPDVNDASSAGATRRWNGGDRVGRRSASAVAVHVNQVEGVDVAWDVTDDVTTAGGFAVAGWVLKVDQEPDGDDEHPGTRLPAGFDRGSGGTVEYFSVEGAAAAGNYLWAPRLVIS